MNKNISLAILLLVGIAIVAVTAYYLNRSKGVNVAMTQDRAVSILKNDYPELGDYPSNNLPPKSIKFDYGVNGLYVDFVQEGSGVPIIGAKCYFVRDDGVTAYIGDYKPADGDGGMDARTCKGLKLATVQTAPPEKTCDEMYNEIDSELKNANYCQVDSDCGVLMLGGSYIKFGCYHYVNKSVDKDTFYAQMGVYDKKCSQMIDDCAMAPNPRCVDGKCVEGIVQ